MNGEAFTLSTSLCIVFLPYGISLALFSLQCMVGNHYGTAGYVPKVHSSREG